MRGFSFPASTDQTTEATRSYIKSLIERLPDDGESNEMKNGMATFLTKVAIRRQYSLRRIERVLTQFGLCIAFTTPKNLRLGAIVFVLCDLKLSSPVLFKKAKLGTLTFKELQDLYQFEDDDDWQVRWLRYFYDNGINRKEQEWQSYSSALSRYNVRDARHASIYLANNIVDNIRPL